MLLLCMVVCVASSIAVRHTKCTHTHTQFIEEAFTRCQCIGFRAYFFFPAAAYLPSTLYIFDGSLKCCSMWLYNVYVVIWTYPPLLVHSIIMIVIVIVIIVFKSFCVDVVDFLRNRSRKIYLRTN